jgi:hypothetical protein
MDIEKLKAQAKMPAKNVKANDRLTCKLTVTHQQVGEPAESVEGLFSAYLDDSEQSFRRKITIGATPVKLDLSWVGEKKVGHLFIDNTTGKRLDQNPTEEELTKIENSVVTLMVSSPGANEFVPFGYVRQGRFTFIDLIPDIEYWVVSREPDTKITVVAYVN